MLSANAARYISETVRLWLGVPRSHAQQINPLPDPLPDLLLRTEELTNPHRDHNERWEHTFSANYRHGKLWEPEIDLWLDDERRRLEANDVPLTPMWPDPHPFAVCLTHDVDALSSQRTPADRLRKIKMTFADPAFPTLNTKDKLQRSLAVLSGPLRKNPAIPDCSSTLARSIAIEEANAVKSSYFFTVHPLQIPSRFDCTYALDDLCLFQNQKVPARHILRYLADRGFDVGLHGSFYSPTHVDMLKRQKARVEDAVQRDVTTIRQHYLRYSYAKTPALQAQAGFLADSTLGFNRNLGFRSGTSLPYNHFDQDQDLPLPLVQLPLIVHDGAIFRSNSLEYDLELAKQTVGLLLDRIRATHGCATLLFHPEVLLDSRYELLFQWCIDYGKNHHAWFATLHEIQTWWRARNKALESTLLD